MSDVHTCDSHEAIAVAPAEMILRCEVTEPAEVDAAQLRARLLRAERPALAERIRSAGAF